MKTILIGLLSIILLSCETEKQVEQYSKAELELLKTAYEIKTDMLKLQIATYRYLAAEARYRERMGAQKNNRNKCPHNK